RAVCVPAISGSNPPRPPAPTSPEYRLRQVIRGLTWASTQPTSQLVELMNTGRTEAVGATRVAIEMMDRATYPIIRARRNEDLEGRTDILSLLLNATYEDG